MFNTAYETLPCRMYRMDEIYKAVAMATVNGNGSVRATVSSQFTQTQDHKDLSVTTSLLVDGTPNIPLFAHPIVITNHANAKTVHHDVVIDARDVTKIGYDGDMKIVSLSEYNLQRARVILQSKWTMNIGAGALSAPVHNFPMRVFSRWIADALARRFNLDLDASVRVQALAGFMYMSMHNTTKEFPEYELVDIAMKVSRAVNIPTNIAAEVLNHPAYFSSVEEFCDELSQRVGSSRLDGLNPVVIYGIIKGSWFGKNASELVSVAIEHPPTFDALIYAAASTSSLQRTILGTLVKGELRDREAMSFVEKINHLMLDKQ